MQGPSHPGTPTGPFPDLRPYLFVFQAPAGDFNYAYPADDAPQMQLEWPADPAAGVDAGATTAVVPHDEGQWDAAQTEQEWQTAYDEEGNVYYYSEKTGASQVRLSARRLLSVLPRSSIAFTPTRLPPALINCLLLSISTKIPTAQYRTRLRSRCATCYCNGRRRTTKAGKFIGTTAPPAKANLNHRLMLDSIAAEKKRRERARVW